MKFPLPKLIILDKDGTIISFTALYRSWMMDFIDRMESHSGHALRHLIYAAFGFDPAEDKFRAGPGLLCEITMERAKEKAASVVAGIVGAEKANGIIATCWMENELTSAQLELTCDFIPLLRRLRQAGVKVAMCTNDTRVRAFEALHHFHLAGDFDLVVAHGDDGFQPKPDPACALAICERLGVEPREAVMVGDTRADTEMGKNAKLGCTIGVLSGIGSESDLSHADVILDSLQDITSIYPGLD